MSGLTTFLLGARAILSRDARVFVTYRAQLISMVMSSVFGVALFFYVSRLVSAQGFGPGGYFEFVVLGIALNQVLLSSFEVASSVRGELLAGTLERLVVSPFGLVAGILAMLVFPTLLAVAVAVLTLLAAAVLFGLDLELDTAILALPIAALGSLAFASIGLLISCVALLFKQGANGATLVTTALTLVAGFYFPVSLLPGWIEWTSEVQPFTPALDLLRHVLVGTPLEGEAWEDLVKLAGFAVILLPVSIRALSATVARTRKTGTIIEY